VAGALLGCKLGYQQLHGRWLRELKEKKWLDVKVNRLLHLMGLEELQVHYIEHIPPPLDDPW
jgi:hypothetical protein